MAGRVPFKETFLMMTCVHRTPLVEVCSFGFGCCKCNFRKVGHPTPRSWSFLTHLTTAPSPGFTGFLAQHQRHFGCGCFSSSLELKGFSSFLALGWLQALLEDSGEKLFSWVCPLDSPPRCPSSPLLAHASAEEQDSSFLPAEGARLHSPWIPSHREAGVEAEQGVGGVFHPQRPEPVQHRPCKSK